MTGEEMVNRDALAGLDPSERERLEAVVVDMGYGNTRPMSALVQGWADHVDRFIAERDLDPDDRDRWTPDDFVAALYIRGFVEKGLRALPDDLAAVARRAIEPVDAAFTEFTAPDADGLLGRWLPPEEHGEGWWWGRVPVAGPVAHDLLELRRRLG
jgi:hypothetical protein